MTGGVIGIGYFKGAICSLDPKDVAKAISHVRDVVGIDCVGLAPTSTARRRSVSTRAR
jgi:microsomal dipeptidase-like Zn-dependent dipeptidase